MTDLHSRIIATAAKAELVSLGFRRQGRSRLWLADRGSWLNVVEFTPRRWLKSVSLTNAVHWLWVGAGFMSFNEAVPSHANAEFETEDQFRGAANEMAKTARFEAVALDERFASFDGIADFVVGRARSSPDRMGQSWWGYEAGIACGLIGRPDEASGFFLGLTDERVIGRAAPLLPLIADCSAFRRRVSEIVAEERKGLKLGPLSRPAF